MVPLLHRLSCRANRRLGYFHLKGHWAHVFLGKGLTLAHLMGHLQADPVPLGSNAVLGHAARDKSHKVKQNIRQQLVNILGLQSKGLKWVMGFL